MKKIGRYVYNSKQKIGKGFKSTVHKGFIQNSHQSIAIKIIDLSKLQTQVQWLLLRNQIKALKLCNHQNIVKLIQIIESKNNMYIITQLCQTDLFKLINEGINQLEALKIIQYILKGYLFLIQHQIIHRDLKPSNILLKNNIPKICDFGFCDHISGQKASIYYNVGTASYMSPQAFMNAQYSAKSDIWSIGVILYQMLVKKPFINNNNYDKDFQLFKQHGLPYIKNVRETTMNLINKCLIIDVEKRITPYQLLRNLKQRNVQNQNNILKKRGLKIVNINLRQKTNCFNTSISYYKSETNRMSKQKQNSLHQIQRKTYNPVNIKAFSKKIVKQITECNFEFDLLKIHFEILKVFYKFLEQLMVYYNIKQGIQQQKMTLLLIKLCNLKIDQLGNLFKGNNVLNISNLQNLLNNPNMDLKKQQFFQIKKKIQSLINNNHPIPLPYDFIFNQFLFFQYKLCSYIVFDVSLIMAKNFSKYLSSTIQAIEKDMPFQMRIYYYTVFFSLLFKRLKQNKSIIELEYQINIKNFNQNQKKINISQYRILKKKQQLYLI